jgi:hypothetical protein
MKFEPGSKKEIEYLQKILDEDKPVQIIPENSNDDIFGSQVAEFLESKNQIHEPNNDTTTQSKHDSLENVQRPQPAGEILGPSDQSQGVKDFGNAGQYAYGKSNGSESERKDFSASGQASEKAYEPSQIEISLAKVQINSFAFLQRSLCAIVASDENPAKYDLTPEEKSELKDLYLIIPKEERPTLFENPKTMFYISLLMVAAPRIISASKTGYDKTKKGEHGIANMFYTPKPEKKQVQADFTNTIKEIVEQPKQPEKTLVKEGKTIQMFTPKPIQAKKQLKPTDRELKRTDFQIDSYGNYLNGLRGSSTNVKVKASRFVRDAKKRGLSDTEILMEIQNIKTQK